MADLAQLVPQDDKKVTFQLIDWDKNGEEKVLAAVLYRFGQVRDYQSCLNYVSSLSKEELRDLAEG